MPPGPDGPDPGFRGRPKSLGPARKARAGQAHSAAIRYLNDETFFDHAAKEKAAKEVRKYSGTEGLQ